MNNFVLSRENSSLSILWFSNIKKQQKNRNRIAGIFCIFNSQFFFALVRKEVFVEFKLHGTKYRLMMHYTLSCPVLYLTFTVLNAKVFYASIPDDFTLSLPS